MHLKLIFTDFDNNLLDFLIYHIFHTILWNIHYNAIYLLLYLLYLALLYGLSWIKDTCVCPCKSSGN